jgi:hypothetical protein
MQHTTLDDKTLYASAVKPLEVQGVRCAVHGIERTFAERHEGAVRLAGATPGGHQREVREQDLGAAITYDVNVKRLVDYAVLAAVEHEGDATNTEFEHPQLLEAAQVIFLIDVEGVDFGWGGGNGARVESRQRSQGYLCSVGVHDHNIVVAKVDGLV